MCETRQRIRETRYKYLAGNKRYEQRLEKGDPWCCWNWGKWGLLEYIWKGRPSLVGSLPRWAHRACTVEFCSALAALVSPVQNIIFLAAHFFTLIVPIFRQPGQTVVLGRLSLCLWVWGGARQNFWDARLDTRYGVRVDLKNDVCTDSV